MILNVFSVLLLFMDAVSLVLMVWGSLAAIKLLAGSRDVALLVGGPDGLAEPCLARSDSLT